jgi:hypothetical protein
MCKKKGLRGRGVNAGGRGVNADGCYQIEELPTGWLGNVLAIYGD